MCRLFCDCWGGKKKKVKPPKQKPSPVFMSKKKGIPQTKTMSRRNVDRSWQLVPLSIPIELTEKRIVKSPDYLSTKEAMETLYKTKTPSAIDEQQMTRPYNVPGDFEKGEDVFAYHNVDILRFAKFLGQGGFGDVFEGQTLDNGGTRVAIKELLDATNEKHEKQIKNELFVMTKVNHPNIVKLLDHFTINRDLYLIMECVDGKLKDELKIRGPFTEELAKVWMKEIIEAVKHLHDMNIAHLDIKLSNVLLTKSGQTKLSDFGLSRICAKDGKTTYLRQHLGTPNFMAPEIVRGKPINGFAADVWALGVCLYLLVNKTFPFDFTKGDKAEQYHKQKHATWAVESEYTLEPPSKSLLNLLCSMMQFKVEKRIKIDEALEHPWFTGKNYKDTAYFKRSEIIEKEEEKRKAEKEKRHAEKKAERKRRRAERRRKRREERKKKEEEEEGDKDEDEEEKESRRRN